MKVEEEEKEKKGVEGLKSGNSHSQEETTLDSQFLGHAISNVYQQSAAGVPGSGRWSVLHCPLLTSASVQSLRTYHHQDMGATGSTVLFWSVGRESPGVIPERNVLIHKAVFPWCMPSCTFREEQAHLPFQLGVEREGPRRGSHCPCFLGSPFLVM